MSSTDTPGTQDAPPGPTIAELAEWADLDDEAIAVLSADLGLKANIELLAEEGFGLEAVRMLAHALPPRGAVWWGWGCAKQAAGDEAPDEVRRPKKRSRLLSFNDHEMSCLQITTPFTLRAEKVTVLELGSVWRDQYAQNYWSSTGCKFHHAYPVGYRATKTVFRKTYEMSIEEGETAPVFCVQDTVSGREWRGESPTNPWTAVCIHENTGQRISGPKFYGFSDLFTLKALAKNLYNEEELAAAVSGSVTFNRNMTDEELRAKEFCDSINGCGPKMAEILAREDVTGTGGTPKSLPELAAWARLTPENRKKLYLWLTTSDCIPEKTRRWSVWYKSIAHRITDGIANH